MSNRRSKIKIDYDSLILLIKIKEEQIKEKQFKIFELQSAYADIAKKLDLITDSSSDVKEIFIRVEFFIKETNYFRHKIQDIKDEILITRKEISQCYKLRREILYSRMDEKNDN